MQHVPALMITCRNELRRVWIRVPSHLSEPAGKLLLYWANHLWPRHALPHRHTDTRGMYTCDCGARNASVAFDWPGIVMASWWVRSAGFRLESEHVGAHPFSPLHAPTRSTWCNPQGSLLQTLLMGFSPHPSQNHCSAVLLNLMGKWHHKPNVTC